MQYASSNGTDWAEEWVVGRAVAYLFPTDGVFLGRESELAKGSSHELLLGGSVDVQPTLTDEELDITHAERCMVFTLGTAILAWTHQEEKGDNDHISTTKCGLTRSRIAKDAVDAVLNDRNGNRLEPSWWWIRFGHVTELLVQASINSAEGI
jgi:hypothetical protein